MERDLKEVVGTLMLALSGARISRGEAADLAFEADGDLMAALNEAYITLLEYAYDCDAGVRKPLRPEMRSKLQHSLDEIVRLSDAIAK
jgi:hypothetical protein